jgi:hypothetical protein
MGQGFGRSNGAAFGKSALGNSPPGQPDHNSNWVQRRATVSTTETGQIKAKTHSLAILKKTTAK